MKMEQKSYEVKYCPERKENVSIQVVRDAKGGVRRRCLCGDGCRKAVCTVCRTSGVLVWK